MKTKLCAILIIIVILMLNISAYVRADDMVISVDKPTVKVGQLIDVHVRITGNTGICGAVVTVNYDSSLTLTDITQGEALSTLNMTHSANISNKSVNLVWDGIEEDDTNGIIATLTFDAPKQLGDFNVSVSYDDKNIVNSELETIPVISTPGNVKTEPYKELTITFGEQNVSMSIEDNVIGSVLIAYYNDKDEFILLQYHEINDENIKIDDSIPCSYAKIMWWQSGASLRPLCAPQIIKFN